MKKKEFTYPSADGKTTIHAAIWKPEGEARGIVQISHGMTEYINSYDEVAEWLTDAGFIVAGNDHLGHGESVRSAKEYGYFGKYEYMIGDMETLRGKLQKSFPGVPYFLWGHSMGAFLGRRYIQLYSEGMSGAIFSGVGSVPESALSVLVCGAISLTRGGHFYSKMIDSKESYFDRIPDRKTDMDWLSSNEEFLARYMADPYNSIQIKINGYYELGRCIYALQKPKNIELISKALPIFLLSGAEDGMGQYGKFMDEIYDSYQLAGMINVTKKLYPDSRHHLIYEPCREELKADIVKWLTEIA